MKKSTFSEAQIDFEIKQSETGTRVEEVSDRFFTIVFYCIYLAVEQ